MTPSSARSAPPGAPAGDRLLALAGVAFVHLLLLQAVATGDAGPAPDTALDLVFLLPDPPVARTPLRQVPVVERPRTGHASSSRSARMPSPAPTTAARLGLQVEVIPSRMHEAGPSGVTVVHGDDGWGARPAAGLPPGAAGDPAERAQDPRVENRPDRFRMRRLRSPEDVVKGVAQFIGLWPPGYDPDPCPEISRSVTVLSGSTDPGERRQLEDALERERKYCR